MTRNALACLTLVAACVNGCALPDYRPGAVLAAHRAGEEDALAETYYPGQYALYRAGKSTPVAKRKLDLEQPIGFERASDGRLAARAGGDLIPLKEGEYRWRLLPAPPDPKARRKQLRETLKACAIVTGAVLVTGLVVYGWLRSDGSVELFDGSDDSPATQTGPLVDFN